MSVRHPNGFGIEYIDFYYASVDRTIRLALCPALSVPYPEAQLDWICSKCPVHKRRRTDLFCFPFTKEPAYRRACEELIHIDDYRRAYAHIVNLIASLQRGVR